MTSTLAVKRVAIAGNPNTGKSTLFNRLTGLSAKVGNYPGVTVESEIGELVLPRSGAIELVDVPGTYSLTARSAEETVAIQAICGLHPLERPDAVLLVVDASQLARNLYLVLQVIEADLPIVVALNMVDMLRSSGHVLDVAALQRELGIPVVPIAAQLNENLERLKSALDDVLQAPERGRPGPRWIPTTRELQADVRAVALEIPSEWHRGEVVRRDALALWALLSLDENDEIVGAPPALRETVLARRRAAAASGREIEAEIIRGRFAWIDARAASFVREPTTAPRVSRTDRADRVLLHPAAGFAIFLTLMGLVFQSLFSWADPAISAIESLFGVVKGFLVEHLPAGIVTDFLVNGVIEGVGSVLVFLPQILLLFLFIGVMEDSGYMARIAFLMDRLMKSVGLNGRAFVPMMSGFACAVPAILATRTMERQRDRLLTMLVVPLMTCSARLPVYSLLIAALFPPDRIFGVLPVQGLLMVAMYVFSTALALIVAAVLGRSLVQGRCLPLLIEMPPYRRPHWRSVLAGVWRKSRMFLTEAGTVILACTVIMWGLLTFPKSTEMAARHAAAVASVERETPAGEARDAQIAEIAHAHAGEELRASYGGRIGRAMEPVIEPLGFDWKIGIGLLGAFAAREVFVSTMGVVYGLGDEVDDQSIGLRDRIRTESRADGKRVYTPLVGLSLMVFFAIACQCMSTLAVVRRETRSWRWPAFLFAYTLALAWMFSFATFQGGRLLGLS